MECGFDRCACELACGGYGRGLNGRENLSVGRVIGGLLELASQEQGLLDEKGFERRLCLERAAGHW